MLPLKQTTKDLTKRKPPFTYLVERGVKGGAPWSLSYSINRALPGSRVGYNSPDWRNKVQRKEDATTPLDLRVDDIKYVNVNSVYRYRKLNKTDKDDFVGVATACPSPIYIDGDTEFGAALDVNLSCYKEARNIALTYQRKYVADVIQPLQSQVFLGEIKETLSFIRHPFAKLIALANSAKVTRYNAAIKHYNQVAIKHRGGVFARTNEARLLLGDIADAWFEVKFAFLPLMQDITAAIGVVANGQTSKRRSSFRGDSKQTLSSLSDTLYPIGQLGGYRICSREAVCQYFINTGIIFSDGTNYSGLTEYLESSTKSLIDFVPTVWELTPGSWLVDYFVNVGDILNSVAVSSKVTKSYDCHTAVLTKIHRYNWRLASSSAVQLLSTGPLAYTEYSRKWVKRSVSTDSFPSVQFSFPTGFGQLANTSLYLSRKLANLFH